MPRVSPYRANIAGPRPTETRHSVAPRIHALSVDRVDRHPRLGGRVLSADRLYHGCGVVDFTGSGHGGRPDLAYEKRAKRHPGMVGVISHRPVRYLSHITVISGAQNRQARRPKNAAVFLVFGAGSLFPAHQQHSDTPRKPLAFRWSIVQKINKRLLHHNKLVIKPQ